MQKYIIYLLFILGFWTNICSETTSPNNPVKGPAYELNGKLNESSKTTLFGRNIDMATDRVKKQYFTGKGIFKFLKPNYTGNNDLSQNNSSLEKTVGIAHNDNKKENTFFENGFFERKTNSVAIHNNNTGAPVLNKNVLLSPPIVTIKGNSFDKVKRKNNVNAYDLPEYAVNTQTINYSMPDNATKRSITPIHIVLAANNNNYNNKSMKNTTNNEHFANVSHINFTDYTARQPFDEYSDIIQLSGDTPPTNPAEPGTPISGGIFILLLCAMGYMFLKKKQAKRKALGAN
ncbi:hypothetical protein D0T49_08875 [Paludibacter sp. 221]|uniref:hypothetical protein n=1 Tax=Paludibacter sp. 221 TaxID=2302939 RepID=UPI0013D6AB4D|nr:hypothetical protein [Paludibacter sp. 221]NDV47156.1 hypothetical protein [Paludibacter sp. 221]